jgi:hypothetical protein
LAAGGGGGGAVYYCGVDCQRRDWRRHRLEVHAVPEPPQATGAVQFGRVYLSPELVIEIVAKLDAAHQRDYTKAAQSAQRFAAVSHDAYVAVNDYYLRRYALEIGAPSDAMPAVEDERNERGPVVDWPRRYVATRRTLDANRVVREWGGRSTYFSSEFVALLIGYNAAAYIERALTPLQQTEMYAAAHLWNPYIKLQALPVQRVTELIARFKTTQELVLEDLPNLREISASIGELVNLRQIYIKKCPQLREFPVEMYRLKVLKFTVVDCPLVEGIAVQKRLFQLHGNDEVYVEVRNERRKVR